MLLDHFNSTTNHLGSMIKKEITHWTVVKSDITKHFDLPNKEPM